MKDEKDVIMGVLYKNPGRMGGVWCVLDTRIPVSFVMRDALRIPHEIVRELPKKLRTYAKGYEQGKFDAEMNQYIKDNPPEEE